MRTLLTLMVLSFLLAGCLPDGLLPKEGPLKDFLDELGERETAKSVYLSLEISNKGQLPMEPHVVEAKARPTMAMVEASAGVPLKFRILDKRTLEIHELEVAVGQRRGAPWGGSIQPEAYLSDLVVRDGRAEHGPEGHVNPVAWVVLFDERDQPLHQGWVFVRDTAQTAWDHPRYDLTFLGMVKKRPPGAPLRKRGKRRRG